MRLTVMAVAALLLAPVAGDAQLGRIQVMATGTVVIPPRKAILTVVRQIDDADESAARRRAEEALAQMTQGLIALQVPDLVLREPRLDVQPYWELGGYRYTKDRLPYPQSKRQDGYRVSFTLSASVTTDSGQAFQHMDRVAQALQAQGVSSQVTYAWDWRDTQKWQLEAISAATKQTMAAAHAVAAAAGQKIKSFDYFGFTSPGGRGQSDEIGPRIVEEGPYRRHMVCTIWAVARY